MSFKYKLLTKPAQFRQENNALSLLIKLRLFLFKKKKHVKSNKDEGSFIISELTKIFKYQSYVHV